MTPTEFSGVASSLLWVIFLISLLSAGVFGLFFGYHWARYSASPVLALFSITVYAAGALLLLGIMLGAILSL